MWRTGKGDMGAQPPWGGLVKAAEARWRDIGTQPLRLDSRVGVGWPEPPSPLVLVGVGRVSCVTPYAVSATGGVELMSLASMAQVTCSVSSLSGMFE